MQSNNPKSCRIEMNMPLKSYVFSILAFLELCESKKPLFMPLVHMNGANEKWRKSFFDLISKEKKQEFEHPLRPPFQILTHEE